jgi:outer membrane protein TolC
VKRAEGYVTLARALFREGQVPERDIAQAQATLGSAKYEAASAAGQIESARAELRAAMGLSWDVPLEIKGELSSAETLPDLKTFIGQALPRHPEVQRAEADVDAAKARVRIAESQRKPTVVLNSAAGVQDYSLPPTSDTYLFSLTARIPFRDGGQSRAEIAEAKAALASAQATLTQIQRGVESKIAQAWHLAQSAQEQIKAAQEAMPPALESLRLAEEQYRLGLRSLLDVNDAQVQLRTAQTNLAQAVFNYRVAEAQLQQAAGLLEEAARKP